MADGVLPQFYPKSASKVQEVMRHQSVLLKQIRVQFLLYPDCYLPLKSCAFTVSIRITVPEPIAWNFHSSSAVSALAFPPCFVSFNPPILDRTKYKEVSKLCSGKIIFHLTSYAASLQILLLPKNNLETSKKLWESRKKFGKAKVRGQSHKIRYRREEAAGYDR